MHKFLLYTCILISFFFLWLGKSYSREQLSAANFLAEKNIIHNWSKIPPRYRFNDNLLLVDALNMSLSLKGIKKNTYCRWDFSKNLPPNTIELCRTFEAAKDADIFDPQDIHISPLELLTHKDFFDIMGVWNIADIYLIPSDEKIKRWEAFVLLYRFLDK